MKNEEKGIKRKNIIITVIFVLILFVIILFMFVYNDDQKNNNVTNSSGDSTCVHDYVELDYLYVPGDCYTKDKITYICSKCGHTYTYESTYCHSWNWEKNTCNNCGKKYEDYAPNK